MKIKTDIFREILLKIKPALAVKGIVEQATHFVFSGDDIFTYNDKISISYPLETDFKCSVPSEILYGIVKDLKGDSIELELVDMQLKLTCGRTKAGINISTDETLLGLIDDMGFPGDDDWKPIDKEFMQGINLCIFSASKDISCPYMTCISVEKDRLVSGDDVRISLYKLNKSISDNFLLPANAAVELIKLDIVEYALMESWVFFGTKDGIVFCSRTVPDEYPDVSEFFKMDDGPKIQLPSKFSDSIKTVSPMADGDFDIDKQVEISISDGVIKCRSDGSGGWAESDLETKEKVPDLAFSVNPIFMLDILDKGTTLTYEPGKILIESGRLNHLMSLYE